MKTQWTAPGTGATLTDLLAQASAALPHLCRPTELINGSIYQLVEMGEDQLPTDLAITETGTWEEYDMARIHNCRISR